MGTTTAAVPTDNALPPMVSRSPVAPSPAVVGLASVASSPTAATWFDQCFHAPDLTTQLRLARLPFSRPYVALPVLVRLLIS